jgi:glycosyltransferase involved in cell wall biosynthesis
MKVVYDYQIFSLQQFGGISRYFCSLASELKGFPAICPKIVAPFHVNKHLRDADAELRKGVYVPRVPKTGRLVNKISAALYSPIAASIRPVIVHETYYRSPRVPVSRMARVVTVYDMIHERFPDQVRGAATTAADKARAIKRADHVFCISESTRRDLLELLTVPEEKVTVTHLGYDQLVAEEDLAHETTGGRPVLLYVGARDGYKNFWGLARAVASSPWLRDNFRIVCFGSAPFSPGERSALARLGLGESQVAHLQGGDRRLAALYAGAAALVYPSIYEGFGMPPLEAMSLGCPVICSLTSSIPEVVADAGEYFDPISPESIREALERVLQSPERRAELIASGSARCRLFSWDRCARETYRVYETLS